MRRLDTKYTDNLICPHCKHEHGDSWEIRDADNPREYDCEECETPFVYTTETRRTFSSSPAPAPAEEK